MTRLVLDEIVDAYEARVVVERDRDGRAIGARFDLGALPRLDPLLVGRPVRDVPSLVERLCGICPAAHHLAGVRALESLAGIGPLPPAADAVRRLLHHGSAIAAHTPRLGAGTEDVAALLGFARAASVAAGSPGHFPTTAIPGGVRAAVSASARADLAGRLDAARDAAVRLARGFLDRSFAGGAPADGPSVAGPPAAGAYVDPFAGADVALVDEQGRPDLLGSRLRALAADGEILVAGALPTQWDEIIAEADPGASAPRPYLVALGPCEGLYRVGPLAQLRIGPLTTPVAAELQADWLARGGGAAAARAVVTVHCVEAIGALLDSGSLDSGPLGLGGADGGADPAGVASGAPLAREIDPRPVAGVGVGWVDGPRGLLVHRYGADPVGILTAATILTPTAQNEPWLAELLRRAVADEPIGVAPDIHHDTRRLEDAIREADPCLPCSSAPVGGMGLRVDQVAARPPEGRN